LASDEFSRFYERLRGHIKAAQAFGNQADASAWRGRRWWFGKRVSHRVSHPGGSLDAFTGMLDGWVYGWMYGWVVGWMGGWIDGWLDGWVYRSMGE